VIETKLAVGFFDGASQSGGEKCGAGAVLKCLEGDIYSIKLSCCMGTNTRGELLAMWSVFFLALDKQVHCLQLVGDSKVIIDWFAYKNNL
jgi:ribonuclease HI